MIPCPCQTCRKHKRCADERSLSRRSLFAWGRGEPAPECPEYREACWRGVDGVLLGTALMTPINPVSGRVMLPVSTRIDG